MFPYVDGNSRETFAELLHQLEQVIAELRAANAQLQVENAELRARIEVLEKNAASGGAGPGKPAGVKSSRPARPAGQPRKKRAKGFARKRSAPTQRVSHALGCCPSCGCVMRGGSVKRTRQVLHIPLVPVQVIEHAFIERCCPQCGKRSVPKACDVLPEVVGRHRLSNSTMALIAALREVGRLPIKTICWYLQTFHALTLSQGEVVAVLHTVVQRAQGVLEQLGKELRASPVVHGDETTWRQEGQNGYFWVFATPLLRYFVHRGSRSGEIVNEVLGNDFDGVLVSDFYGGYNRMEGQHQRCWAHLLRDIHALKEQWPNAPEVATWADQVHALYLQAKDYNATHAETKPRERQVQQQAYERQLLALVEPYLETESPQHVLCKRMATFLPELFTFVADGRVPSDNNAAERAIRPLAVARKISGGTRSDEGTQIKGCLATLFGTWVAQGLNPFHKCLLLLNPP